LIGRSLLLRPSVTKTGTFSIFVGTASAIQLLLIELVSCLLLHDCLHLKRVLARWLPTSNSKTKDWRYWFSLPIINLKYIAYVNREWTACHDRVTKPSHLPMHKIPFQGWVNQPSKYQPYSCLASDNLKLAGFQITSNRTT
jgi:hypothetical protein